MDISFENKTIVITGGTRGIGRAIGELFSECRGNVIVTGRDLNRPVNLRETISYVSLDIDSNASFENFLTTLRELSEIDVLVNNAGINEIAKLRDIKVEDFDRVMNVNLRAPFLICKEVAGLMTPNGGRIVNIGSIWSEITKKGRVSYSASKAGLVGLTRALATELAGSGILVNSISPGFVETELTKASLSQHEIQSLTDIVPLGRLAQVDEIAKFVLFLCSEHNTFTTGQNILVDGGFSNV